MPDFDDPSILENTEPATVAEQCHAAWIVAGCAAKQWVGSATDPIPDAVKHAARDVLSMLDVAKPDALRNRPKRRRRRRVRLRDPR